MESPMTDREYTLSLAVEEAKSRGLRATARHNYIPLPTLKDRVNRAYNFRVAHEKDQSLTAVQEDDLIDFILMREKVF
jgi:hypothetical protein